MLFTIDLGPAGLNAAPLTTELEELLEEFCRQYPNARVVEVDYGSRATAEVSRFFSQKRAAPVRDCYGKVVYPYFFGVSAAKHRYVLHSDSDMLFGGGSQTWIREARRALAEREVFTCSPFPGPPSPDPLPRHVAIRHAGSRKRRSLATNAVPHVLEGVPGPALRFTGMSTRCFMLDRAMFRGGIAVPVGRPTLRALIGAASKGALARGNPVRAPAETALGRAMKRRGLLRVDFFGSPPGMWSLHPTDRSLAFLNALPDIIRRIEADEIPAGQRGDYDVGECAGDWSCAHPH